MESFNRIRSGIDTLHPVRVDGGLRKAGKFSKLSSSEMPLVTVITVVRNGHEYIERSIQSVLSQAYENIEYIIVDGGSTDDTVGIIKKFDDRISYWMSEPDRGIYDAMNKGISLATGDWVNFMNAGDVFIDKDTVSTVIRNLGDDADLIYGHCQMLYGSGYSAIWKARKVEDLWKGMIFRHQSLFTRTSIYKNMPFDLDFKIGSDFAFIYACYKQNYRFRELDLTISSVTMGGMSDIHLIPALQENRLAVLRYADSFKIRAYYWALIAFTKLKERSKRIIPIAWVNRARTLKYR